ncbi:hypothetical protein ACJ73_03526 [Blastomyces percursus]|uniref:Uncharacterized protein n=1 Tax=Blastomyces percursus TaxID=1658174 RepID=A0A1J9R999_9EURO|nr:hypothetical protein ACJ73_03526 [Blastomyces percursus]
MDLIHKGEYTAGTVFLEAGELSKAISKGFDNDPEIPMGPGEDVQSCNPREVVNERFMKAKGSGYL